MSIRLEQVPDYVENEMMHPLARSAFEILAHCNEASRWHVFRALAARFEAIPRSHEREIMACSALRACLDDLQQDIVSAGRFDEWRAAQPDPGAWPSAATIRRIFRNGWSSALAAVSATPITRFSSVRRRARGKTFSDEEVRRAACTWAREEQDALINPNYRSWAKRQREAGVRVPMDPVIFKERFGKTVARVACDELGLDFDDVRRSASGVRFSDSDVVRALEAAVLALGPDLTRDAYRDWRDEKLEQGLPDIPSSATVADRLGNGVWKTAVTSIRISGDSSEVCK